VQFDWVTFLLEFVNFLVLVWLLTRFFYKPVRNVIEARKKSIEHKIAEAEKTRTEADALKERYERRLTDWEVEKQKLRDRFQVEITAEREQKLTALEDELAQKREKARAIEEHKAHDREAELRQEALARGGKFVSKIFSDLATRETEQRLIELLLKELQKDVSDGRFKQLQPVWTSTKAAPVLATAYPLENGLRRKIASSLEAAFGKPGAPLEFQVEPSLLAGPQLRVGSVALSANLHDELRMFQETFHAG